MGLRKQPPPLLSQDKLYTYLKMGAFFVIWVGASPFIPPTVRAHRLLHVQLRKGEMKQSLNLLKNSSSIFYVRACVIFMDFRVCFITFMEYGCLFDKHIQLLQSFSNLCHCGKSMAWCRERRSEVLFMRCHLQDEKFPSDPLGVRARSQNKGTGPGN